MKQDDHITSYEDMVDQSLPDIARSEKVVIFASGLTDTRMIVKLLNDRGIPFRVIEMGMASSRSRVDFRRLCEITNWHLLPQIFVDGVFVGGADELIEYLASG